MTTKTAGGRISARIALTLEATAALNIGDAVHVVGDYQCNLADGTKPIVGFVSVQNRQRDVVTGNYPVNLVPGDVTVEAIGHMVITRKSGGAFAAGAAVGINATGALVAAGGGVRTVGVALIAATGANQDVDVLITDS